MSLERRNELIRELCKLRGIGDAEHVVKTGVVNIDDFDIAIDFFQEDAAAIYVNFQFGVVSGGRTLRVFRLLLEATLSVYAQDQAQLGVEARMSLRWGSRPSTYRMLAPISRSGLTIGS